MSGPIPGAGQTAPRFPVLRRLAARARAEIRLTVLAIWRGAVGVYNSEDLTFASSIAYYALLSLFPFFLLAFSLLASLAGTTEDRAGLFLFVFRYFPQQFDFITDEFKKWETNRLQLGMAGSILMLWAAMGVFGAVTSAVNHAWGVEKQPSYFKHKMVSLLMLVTAALLMIVGLLLISAMNVVEASWFAHILDVAPGLQRLQTYAWQSATTILFILIVGLVFYFVPNAKVRFRDVWVGAVLTGLLWRLALAGFSRYLKDASRLSVHGTIEGVIAFLLWVYISSVIFLFGAEVTAAYARLRRHRPEEIPAAPSPRV